MPTLTGNRAMYQGCHTALLTPFSTEGDPLEFPIKYDVMEQLIDRAFAPDATKGNGYRGVDGIVIAGCTGSASVMEIDEQVELARRSKEYVDRHHPGKIVIAGDGSNSTKEAKTFARAMEVSAGIVNHLSIAPYVNKPSDYGLIRHYELLADAISGNIIMYSVPGRTGGKGIVPRVAAQLAQHPRIIGIKEASGNMDTIKEIIDSTGDYDFFLTSGDDDKAVDTIRLGGVGVISVISNVVPEDTTLMVHKALSGEYTGADAIRSRLGRLNGALFPKSKGNASPNPVMCHYALRSLGIPVGYPRLPLTDGADDEKREMIGALTELGLIKDSA